MSNYWFPVKGDRPIGATISSVYTHIIGLQIRVILFESVVEDSYHNSLACVAHFPGGQHVQIEAILRASVLMIGTRLVSPPFWFKLRVTN